MRVVSKQAHPMRKRLFETHSVLSECEKYADEK